VLPQCDWSRTLTQHAGARPTNLIIFLSWSPSPHWNAQPRYLCHLLAGKGVSRVGVEVDLGVRGSPVDCLTFSFSIKLEGSRAPLGTFTKKQRLDELYDGFN
jgi:hypothetical protein